MVRGLQLPQGPASGTTKVSTILPPGDFSARALSTFPLVVLIFILLSLSPIVLLPVIPIASKAIKRVEAGLVLLYVGLLWFWFFLYEPTTQMT